MPEQLLIKAFKAHTDITNRRVVKLTDNGLKQVSSATDVMLGIAHHQLAVSAGKHCDVTIIGITDADAGAAFPINAKLTADADGKLVQASDGNQVIAIALETATSADEIIRVLINQSIA